MTKSTSSSCSRQWWQVFQGKQARSPKAARRERGLRIEALERRELMAFAPLQLGNLASALHQNATVPVPAAIGSALPQTQAAVQASQLAATAAVTGAITAIDVIAGNSPNITRAGWERLDLDLNQGAGGKYIYIVYQRGSGTPVTDVTVLVGKNASAPAGYTKINVDLNAGAGGDYLYLCYRKSSSAVPIDNLKLISGNSSGIQYSDPTYTRVNVDLNKGCGSDTPYIYLNYHTKGSGPVAATVRNALAGVAEGYLERQFDGKSFDSSASDTYKKGIISYTVSTSVSAKLSPITSLDLNFNGMAVVRSPDRLIVDLSFSAPLKGSVSGKIRNIASASTNFTATANVTARVEFAISRSGTTITASPKVLSLSGKVSNVQFSNDVANTLRGYMTRHVNNAIEKDAQDFTAQLNTALAAATKSGKFSLELKKLF